ncbi:MAG: DNA polymerase III subunit gamma/tau [Clostridia bacterium]
MGYVALYRKYRPNKFNDIVGQENITSILKSQVENLKISHAYIFSGSRGTGKTTAAKVFSRAINCLNPVNGEPCNECSACRSILSGDTTDVVEMDAASNNSVDNIRQIRSEVVYAATSLKYRVYIIDEVHMLTTSAFNALLKTLEEPPDNVVFILATTEQHKIPVTILSRCLRFEFSKISEEKIKERLEYVLKEENTKYEIEALEYISKLADGALRDALSILDRCLSEKEDILTLSKVEEIIGAIDKDILSLLTQNILTHNSIEVLNIIDSITKKGKDLRQLIYELTEEFLNILIKTDNVEESLKMTNIIDELSKLDNEIRMSIKPTILVKAALVRISNSVTLSNVLDGSVSNISDKKIQNIENEIKNIYDKLDSFKNNKANENKEIVNIEKKVVNEKSQNTENVNNIEKELLFKDYELFKKSVVEKGKLKLFSTLAGSNMYINNDNILIITNNDFAYKVLTMDEQKESIASILKEEFSIDKPIKVKLEKKVNENKMEQTFKENNVEYTNLD